MFTPQRSWIQTGVMSSASAQIKEEEELNALKRGKVQERPQENKREPETGLFRDRRGNALKWTE